MYLSMYVYIFRNTDSNASYKNLDVARHLPHSDFTPVLRFS